MDFNKGTNAAAAAGTSPSGSDSQDDNLNRIKNEFDSERDQNQELNLKFGDVEMIEYINNEEKAEIQNCQNMLYESDMTKERVHQQSIATKDGNMLEIGKSLDNIKKLGSVNENHIMLVKQNNEGDVYQEKIKIADNTKRIENIFKSFGQREAEFLQKLSEQNSIIIFMGEKHDENILNTKISDLDGISKTLENEEQTLIKDEVKSSKLRLTDLEQNSKSEEATLTKKLEFMAKREEKMKENVMNLNLEQRNEVLQLKNLDLHDSKLSEETNMPKQKISKTKLLIEEDQANIIELKINEDKELEVLSNINLATKLQMNNNQALNEESILQLKSYDLEAVERKKLICSSEREIENVQSIINKDEIIDKESSLCKLNNEEKNKVNSLKLQLQEKKDNLNKKSQTFNEEIRMINEECLKLQVSSEQELEKYKTETLKEEIKNIENEYFVTKTGIDFYQNEKIKNKTEKPMKEQQKQNILFGKQ